MNAQLQTYPTSEFNLLINGELVAGASTFDVINPATEELLAVCPRADLAQLQSGGRGCQGRLSGLVRPHRSRSAAACC